MADFLAPALAACFAWWFATGAVMWLVASAGERSALLGPALGAGALVAAVAGAGLAASVRINDSASAYCGFACALLIWGVIEFSFLTGAITGPNRAPCPPNARGLARFGAAAASLIYHEVLIAVALVLILALSWGQPNSAGALTFAILAVMRLSAKLNIFLGAPGLSDEFLPKRLAHLKTYFARGAFNPLFPISLLGGAIVAAALAALATAAPNGGADETAYALGFVLLVLALIEHLFMMTHWDDAALWRWAHRAAPKPIQITSAPDQGDRQ